LFFVEIIIIYTIYYIYLNLIFNKNGLFWSTPSI
jgi:hypothetical protein